MVWLYPLKGEALRWIHTHTTLKASQFVYSLTRALYIWFILFTLFQWCTGGYTFVYSPTGEYTKVYPPAVEVNTQKYIHLQVNIQKYIHLQVNILIYTLPVDQ